MKSRSIAMAGAALLAGAVWSQASYASTFTVDIWTDVSSDSAYVQRCQHTRRRLRHTSTISTLRPEF